MPAMSYPRPSIPSDLDLLKEFAPAQNQRIRTLLQKKPGGTLPPHFTFSHQEEWNALWKATWDKGGGSFEAREDVVRDGVDAIDNSLLPDPIPSHCNVATKPPGLEEIWKFVCKKFFVRPEYDEAQAAAVQLCGHDPKESHPYDVLVFSGQPGQGKSVFLFLLLLRRLVRGLPTAMQIDPEYALLFYEGGVLEFGRLSQGALYSSLEDTSNPLSRIWMLADSGADLIEPARTFRARGPFFVVVAASPRSDRIGWTRKTKYYYFYMKPWSFSELIQACSLVAPGVPSSERVLWDLHTRYAPSTRDIFFHCDEPQIYMEIVDRELEGVTPEALGSLLRSPQASSDTSHLLVLIEPSPTSRFVPRMRVVTTHVFNLFWDRHNLNQASDMARLYDFFRGISTTSLVPGMIFEVRIHQLLKKGRYLFLTPIGGRLADRNIVYDDYGTASMTVNKLITLDPLAEAPLTDGIALNPGYYYQPQISNFPTIGSLVLCPSVAGQPPILVIFQITYGVEDSAIKQVGLERIDQLGIPQNAEKVLVIVTPENVKPKITVPMTYLTDAFLAGRTPDTAFPVYHLQIARESLFSATQSP